MERGDIYLVSLDPTSGHEQQGRRPVLIVFTGLQPADENAGRAADYQQVQLRPHGWLCRVADGGRNEPTGVVRCDQPRPSMLASRNARKLESVPSAIMDEVLAKLAPIFE